MHASVFAVSPGASLASYAAVFIQMLAVKAWNQYGVADDVYE